MLWHPACCCRPLGNAMDRRISGAIAFGVTAAVLIAWFVRRRRAAGDDLYVSPRPEWTPPHGDPLAEEGF